MNQLFTLMASGCLNCGKKLAGRQSKFCSRECKNIHNNQIYQSYKAQQLRGRDRKLRLIKIKGEKCQRCGYAHNFAALEFHHINPASKTFQLDLRSLSNRTWDAVLAEAKKCILLCSNCHTEEHNPECVVNDH